MRLVSFFQLSIPLAAAASFLFGGVFYGLLGKHWLAALGKTEAEMKSSGRPIPLLFAITYLAQLVMAWALACVMAQASAVSLAGGMAAGALAWLGFAITILVVNHGYQGSRWLLTVIDGLHWLGVLLIEGAILGILGIR
ncbi:MAG: DUF1761 domain-containing protein [Hyphomicrobiaceae bacterium]|nr:MAG: DUF1761 domain-containing protein [Hyphomicrobiaceae bacterium]